MSPKPGNQLVEPVSTVLKEEKVIKREEIFSRWDKPLHLEQHQLNKSWIGTIHLCIIYCFYLVWTGKVPLSMAISDILYAQYFGGLGITVGCHRYWTHKTFKANLPLQILLMIMQTTVVQYPIHKWCLDHRIHHKYTDTDADPHNSKRGFWFSHVGWLLVPKHGDHIQKLKTFDMSDLEKDPIVRFQSRWWWTMAITLQAIHALVTNYIWEVDLFYCTISNFCGIALHYHFTWSVNSFAHIFGDKPYDKSISSTDNPFVSVVAIGEGYHNYHHVFPWCYQASELGWKINVSTMFIDFFASIGWAYDLKTVSQKMIKDRLRRTGDGSHLDETSKPDIITSEKSDFDYNTPAEVIKLMNKLDKPIWGWDDDSMSEDLRSITKILNKRNFKLLRTEGGKF